MNLNWYPGHMAKSFRLLKAELQRVHLVIECLDARIPLASRNPKLQSLIEHKDRIVLLTKPDLAAADVTKEWIDFFKAQGQLAVAINLKQNSALKQLEAAIRPYRDQLADRDRARGRRPRPFAIACLGIPNVGKSTLTNLLLGKKSNATENRPGLTRGISFISSKNKRYELMDSPGLLWPKLETKLSQVQLALCMAMPDSLLEPEDLALNFLLIWSQVDAESFRQEFQLESVTDYMEAKQALANFADRSKLVTQGGQADYKRAAERLIQQYRQGRIPLSLERPGLEVGLPE